MTDIWSLLLQTLTASGAAALVLAVKHLFQDKLSPRWQFAIWSVPALALLLPAGWGRGYALLNWPLAVEWAKTALTGAFTRTRVLAPIPLAPASPLPRSVWEGLYLLYLAGVVFLLAQYLLSYLRLRRSLHRGRGAEGTQIARVAAQYNLRSCPAVEVDGLSSAFICGVFRPVLALPAGTEVDDKVILHELLHLRYHDAAWGLLICLLRCLHWCNPLLWYCTQRAQNDMETLCDQRVLERLEGEARREYGHILLSMANDAYPSVPGTSSMANGGSNISARIQAIARFKRYPAGMGLVSGCIALVLALGCLVGVHPVVGELSESSHTLAMAQARLLCPSTPAAALNIYATALLSGNAAYLAAVRPLEEHPLLAASPHLDRPRSNSVWQVYNLLQDGAGDYQGLLCFQQMDNGSPGEIVAQTVVLTQVEGAWTVGAAEPLSTLVEQGGSLFSPSQELPAMTYAGGAGDIWMELDLQYLLGFPNLECAPAPSPDIPFTDWYRSWGVRVLSGGEPVRCSLAVQPMTREELEKGQVDPNRFAHTLSAPSQYGEGGGGGSDRSTGAEWQAAPAAISATLLLDGVWHDYLLTPEGGAA